MNLLIDALPETVQIGVKTYPIYTDFRYGLRVMTAFEDNELTPQEKYVILLANLYPAAPPDIGGAIVQANWFLNGGKTSKEEDGGHKLFSFSKDAELIYAAFRQTHGVDLTSAQLHWWQFIAMFMDLGQDTVFCQLIALRKRIKTGKATKEERQLAREMGDLFIVPEVDDRTIEEKEVAERFERQLEELKRQSG